MYVAAVKNTLAELLGLAVVHGIENALNEITDTTRKIDEQSKDHRRKRQDDRATEHAAETKENPTEKIHPIYLGFGTIEINEQIFDYPLACATFIVGFDFIDDAS